MKTFCILWVFVFFSFTNIFSQHKSKSHDVFSHDNPFSLDYNRILTEKSKDLDPSFIDSFLESIMDSEEIPGMTICFLKDGHIFWKKDMGYANVEQGIAVSDSTQFLVCSISKTVVVTAAMQLYEDGLFELDDAINNFLPFEVINPQYPDSLISFRHLMTHTSSIVDDLSLIESLITYGSDSPIALGEFLADYLVDGGKYYSSSNYSYDPPQTEYKYSNVGVSLLAFLVEVLSGQDFEAYCQENIFEPLEMLETSFRLSALNEGLLATPYHLEGEQLSPLPHYGFPVYPAGSLRTSSLQLSRFLSMYMNEGIYNNKRILEEASIDLITTRQFPDILEDNPMGLIWNFDFFFYDHGGSCPGAVSDYGFSFGKHSGVISILNTDNPFMSGFMEFLLYYYSLEYQPFTIKSITINDEDNDMVLEPYEEVELVIKLRNNMNISEQITDVTIVLSNQDPNVSLTSDQVYYDAFSYLENKENVNNPFAFVLGGDNTFTKTRFDFELFWGNGVNYKLDFSLPVGRADVLLVNDAGTENDFFSINYWYKYALDSLGYTHYDYNTELYGPVNNALLANFPVVIWYCAYEDENTLTAVDRDALASYLDNGGRLFLCGQGISEDIQTISFLNEYLHAEHIADSFKGGEFLKGVENDPVSGGVNLQVNQDWGSLYQSSMSVVKAIEGGVEMLYYADTDSCAAVRYEDANYKSIFMGLGYEGISDYSVRLDFLERIMDYFLTTVDIKEQSHIDEIADVKIVPNPFNNDPIVELSMKTPARADLLIYNMQGLVVDQKKLGYLKEGKHQIKISGMKLSPGVYVYVLRTDASQYSGRMVYTGAIM